MQSRYLHAFCRLATFSLLAPCLAQAQTIRPPSIEPGQVQERLQPPIDIPELGAPVIAVPEEKGHAMPSKTGITFTLKALRFEGNSVFSLQQLLPDYTKYIGQPVTLSTLRDIADAITAHYRNKGYILTRAVVPPQRINDGIVTIRMIEGYVDHVRFEGGKPSGPLEDYANKIRASNPLNTETLERYLLLMNDLPGLSAKATFTPSPTAQGASDLVISLNEKHIDGSIGVDNRGTRYMGPFESTALLNANNLLGRYDRTQFYGVSAFEPHELWDGVITHQEPIGNEGSTLVLSGGYTHTQPGDRLTPFELIGRDETYSAALSHPFIRSRLSNLIGNLRFDISQADLSSLGTRLYDDKLKVVRLGGSYDFVDGLSAANRIETSVSHGFNWDVGSDAGARSRAGGQPEFTKIILLAGRQQPISGPFSLSLAASGQMSDSGLLASEQFGLGGAAFGSGYDPSELTGDAGMAGRAELRYSRPSTDAFLTGYQLYLFGDGGKVWNRTPAPGQKSEASLVSTGIGGRFSIMQNVSASAELAFPMTKYVAENGADGKAPRLFFGLSYSF